jgi:hypothetical protein
MSENKPVNEQVLKVAESAPVATFGGAAATLTFWGLHVNEICAIISVLIAGLSLQIWLAFRRVKKLEKGLARNNTVTVAQAEAVRVVDKKLDTLAADVNDKK